MESQMFSSSLGAMGSLLGKLRSLLVCPEDQLPELLKLQKHKLQILKRDLEGINALLVNLSWVEAPNMMVKHWMNEVRDLSYDIEDYIDKTMRHPDPNTSDSCPEDEELSTLVKQAKEAHERHIRYDLGHWASNPKFLVNWHSRVPRHHAEPTYLVGISGSKAELIKRLNIDSERRLVVSILGPVGVGKTTLAKEVYCEIKGKFECQAFVRASKTPDTRKVLYSVISQIQCRRQGPPYGLPVQELIDRLRELLQHKRYLILIDGLWETASWDIVNNAFPEGTYFSRILITTDIEEVALECCDFESDAIFKMEPLSENYSKELFFNRVFGFKHELSEHLGGNTDEIIRTCHGLPLAIISAATIFASQPDNSQLWRHVKEALVSRMRYNLTSEGILREIILLSYNGLPHHLKTCLLYLSMYPEGYTFLKAELVKQWSSEGFIIILEDKTCDEVAECYFDELVCRGLIQSNDINISDDVISYTVHSTVFEVLRNMSVEENFTTVIDYSNTIPELSAKVRRLSLRFSNAKYATKPENITLSPVRSLIFYGLVECLPSITQFEVLRVLILEFWGNQEQLDLSSIDKLFQLRYLLIRTNIMVKLPARMIGLSYLQTMEIHARVTSVPSDIIHLPRLLHLCLPGEINLSNEIGHKRSLRTLQSFDLSSNSEANVRLLGEMKDLRDLHVTWSTEISDPLKRNLIALVSSLEKLGNLKSIIIAPAPSCTSIYLDCSFCISSLSVFLQRLVLLPPICIFPRLPKWIGQLQMLCILKIVLRQLTGGDVDTIARLQKLTILSLDVRQPRAELIVFHRAAFPALKCFKFRCGVIRLAFETDAMPSVRRLKLEFNAHNGEQNRNMISGIEHLLNLQELAGRIGAAPGAEESGRMVAEFMFKDAISKHSTLTSFNLRIVRLFHEEEAGLDISGAGRESAMEMNHSLVYHWKTQQCLKPGELRYTIAAAPAINPLAHAAAIAIGFDRETSLNCSRAGREAAMEMGDSLDWESYWKTTRRYESEELGIYLGAQDDAFSCYDSSSPDSSITDLSWAPPGTVTRAAGKGEAPGAGGAAVGEVANKDILMERDRRRRLNEKLYELRSVVPTVTKMDKASIIKDAIEYIQQLQVEERQILQEVRELVAASSAGAEEHHVEGGVLQQAERTKTMEEPAPSIPAPVEVQELRVCVSEVGDRLLLVSLTCSNGRGAMARVCRALEELGLRVITAKITSVAGRLLHTIFVETGQGDRIQLKHMIEAALTQLNSTGANE